MARKVIAISGRYGDYFNDIQASHKLGYPAYPIGGKSTSGEESRYNSGQVWGLY